MVDSSVNSQATATVFYDELNEGDTTHHSRTRQLVAEMEGFCASFDVTFRRKLNSDERPIQSFVTDSTARRRGR
jgi:hypothetical protein